MAGPVTPTASTHGVILTAGKPTALVPLEMLELSEPPEPEPSQLLDKTASVKLELEAGVERRVDVHFTSHAAVIATDAKPFVVASASPLTGQGDVSRLLRASAVLAFAADTELPGEREDPDDPEVTYLCEFNHRITQRRSDPNRECPLDHSPLEL